MPRSQADIVQGGRAGRPRATYYQPPPLLPSLSLSLPLPFLQTRPLSTVDLLRVGELERRAVSLLPPPLSLSLSLSFTSFPFSHLFDF